MANKKGAGRPRKEIDKVQFEKLCSILCTKEEIAGWFECSEDTIERWCKREYKTNFAEVLKRKSQKAKISIRRSQLKMAEKNVTMSIWLGKQYLGQKDDPDESYDQEDTDTFFKEAGLG